MREAFLLLSLVVAFQTTATAQVEIDSSPVKTLIFQSSAIVAATAQKKQYGTHERRTHTFYTFFVNEVIKGLPSDNELMVIECGGRSANGSGSICVPGFAFQIGQKYLLFLDQQEMKFGSFFRVEEAFQFVVDPETGIDILVSSKATQIAGIDDGHWIEVPRSELAGDLLLMQIPSKDPYDVYILLDGEYVRVTEGSAPSEVQVRQLLANAYPERLQDGASRPQTEIAQQVTEQESDSRYRDAARIEWPVISGIELHTAD